MQRIQTVSLSDCTYNKKTQVLTLPSVFVSGFPEYLIVESHKTGDAFTFKQDDEAAVANEFWDGEQCEYKPVGVGSNVSKLVVYNQ